MKDDEAKGRRDIAETISQRIVLLHPSAPCRPYMQFWGMLISDLLTKGNYVHGITLPSFLFLGGLLQKS